MTREELWFKTFDSAVKGITANSNPSIHSDAENISAFCATLADYSLKQAQARGLTPKNAAPARRSWWRR